MNALNQLVPIAFSFDNFIFEKEEETVKHRENFDLIELNFRLVISRAVTNSLLFS